MSSKIFNVLEISKDLRILNTFATHWVNSSYPDRGYEYCLLVTTNDITRSQRRYIEGIASF